MFDKLFSEFRQSPATKKTVVLTGQSDLKISEIAAVAKENSKVIFKIPAKHRAKIKHLRRHIIDQVKSGVPIYGTTTSYGGRASLILNKGDEMKRMESATALSNAIIHVDVSTGDPIPADVVRAAMLVRINMLLSGHSGIRFKNLIAIKDLINKNITPIVGRYGTLSSSGDLALNGRVLSCLLRKDNVYVWDKKGRVVNAKDALEKAGIDSINLLPKEGLAYVNGDNFSTAAAALMVNDVVSLMLVNTLVASVNIEALMGNTRNFHPLLSALRPHPGQELTARFFRNTLNGSKLATQELRGFKPRVDGTNVQDPYSIRCLPQYYGPDWESLSNIWDTVTINANSVSDNPLWTTPEHTVKGEKPYQWVSGGNFLSMHMVESLDRMRKILIHIIKQNDRNIARLVHPTFNKGLPANLSDKSAISQSTFKGLQTQMGMYEVYASLMAQPVSTAFGIHEEFNQDITSHAFTSAIISWEVAHIAKLSIATDMICACQGVDLRGGPHLLSPKTRPLYDWVRKYVPYVEKEQPLGHYVNMLSDYLLNDDLKLIVVKNLGL